MSGKHKSQKVEEPAKKPKLEVEISANFLDTKNIPDVIWQQIFGYFSWEEIKSNIAKVCRHFYDISNDCVRKIEIEEFTYLDSNRKFEMFNALPTFKYLKTLSIENDMARNYTDIVDFFTLYALKNCPRLKHLKIWSHGLSIEFIDQIFQHGQNLCGLDLDIGSTAIPDILSPLLTGMKNLKHFGLYKMMQSDFTDDNLCVLVKNCKELNSLHFSDCEVSDEAIQKLINLKKDKLKSLFVGQRGIGCEWLNHLESCPKLESLVIQQMRIRKFGFDAISKLKNLKNLQLGNLSANTVIKMLSSGNFKKLETFYIFGIVDSIDALLVSAAFACPILKFMECYSRADNRKIFPTYIIKVLFDNLPELRALKLEWLCSYRSTGNIFVQSQLEKMVENYKNKVEVEICEFDEWIEITREF